MPGPENLNLFPFGVEEKGILSEGQGKNPGKDTETVGNIKTVNQPGPTNSLPSQ